VRVLDDTVAMGKAVRLLLTGDEGGHTPEQLEAVRAAVSTLEHSRCVAISDIRKFCEQGFAWSPRRQRHVRDATVASLACSRTVL
jgi:hypothetical protein